MTTGTSVLNGVKQLKESGLSVSDVFVIIDRLERDSREFSDIGVRIHQLTDILEITNILFQEKLIDEEILEKVKKQISQN